MTVFDSRKDYQQETTMQADTKECALCRYGMEVTKLKRQWVHHDSTSGRIYICSDRILKPGS